MQGALPAKTKCKTHSLLIRSPAFIVPMCVHPPIDSIFSRTNVNSNNGENVGEIGQNIVKHWMENVIPLFHTFSGWWCACAVHMLGKINTTWTAQRENGKVQFLRYKRIENWRWNNPDRERFIKIIRGIFLWCCCYCCCYAIIKSVATPLANTLSHGW